MKVFHSATFQNPASLRGAPGRCRQQCTVCRETPRRMASSVVVLTKPLVSRLPIAPADNLLNVLSRDLGCSESHDRPACQPCVEVFLAIENKPLRAIVTTVNKNAALNFDQCPAFDVGKVSTPSSLRIKSKFWHQGWPGQTSPVEGEFRFESGRIRFRTGT